MDAHVDFINDDYNGVSRAIPSQLLLLLYRRTVTGLCCERLVADLEVSRDAIVYLMSLSSALEVFWLKTKNQGRLWAYRGRWNCSSAQCRSGQWRSGFHRVESSSRFTVLYSRTERLELTRKTFVFRNYYVLLLRNGSSDLKGDLKQCANYRTIALVSHASKILLRIILERIRVKTETEIADEQAAAAAILKNHKNRDITTTDWPIFAKFGMIMQISPFRGETVKFFLKI